MRCARPSMFAAAMLLASMAPREAGAQTADDLDRARSLGQEAAAAYERGEWEAARSLFHRARELYPAPTLGVREARCLVKLGRLVEAKLVYERTIALPLDPNGDAATSKKAQAEAKRELDGVAHTIPYLTLRVASSARALLAIDGVDIPNTTIGLEREADPGQHTITGTLDGRTITPVVFTLGAGEHRVVTVGAQASVSTVEVRSPSGSAEQGGEATSSSPGATQRWVGISLMGLGVVGVGVGVGLGLAAGDKHAQLQAACSSDGICPFSQADDLDAFHTLRTASTIAYVAGGVLAAGGLVLVLVAPRKSAASSTVVPTVTPIVGFGTFALRGSF